MAPRVTFDKERKPRRPYRFFRQNGAYPGTALCGYCHVPLPSAVLVIAFQPEMLLILASCQFDRPALQASHDLWVAQKMGQTPCHMGLA